MANMNSSSPHRQLRDTQPVPTVGGPSFYYTANASLRESPLSRDGQDDWLRSFGQFQPRPLRSAGSPSTSSIGTPFKIAAERRPPRSPLTPPKGSLEIEGSLSKLRSLLYEAVAIAENLFEVEMDAEITGLVTKLVRAIGIDMEEPTDTHQASSSRPLHITIPEIKQLGASPFLFRKLCRAQAQVELLLGLAFDFSSVQTLEQLQTRVSTLCPFLTKSGSCNLYLCGDESLYDIGMAKELPLVGIVGHAARGWEPCHVLFPANDPRFHEEVDNLEAKVYLCYPLQSQGRLLGIVRFIRFHSDSLMYTTEELQFIDALSDIIAFNLYHLLRPVTVLETSGNASPDTALQASTAGSLLSLVKHLANAALDEEKLVATVMQKAKELTNSDRCSLFIVKDNELEAHFAEGVMVHMPIDMGIAGYVATRGEKVQIEDAYLDKRFNQAIDLRTGYRTKSLLCLPVMYENTVVAVAQLVNKLNEKDEYISFSNTDEELFEPFAEFAGICLRNCRMHCKLVEQERRGAIYSKVLEEVSGQSLEDKSNVCTSITVGIQELVRCHTCILYAVDPQQGDMDPESITCVMEDGSIQTNTVKPLRSFIDLAHRVRSSRQEMMLDAKGLEEEDKNLVGEYSSILTLPILVNGKVIGVTQVVKGLKEDPFNAQDIDVVRSLSMFAGIALSNRHLLHFVVAANQKATELIRLQSFSGGAATSPKKTKMIPLNEDLVQQCMSIDLDPAKKQLVRTLDFNIFEYMDPSAPTEKSMEVVPLLVNFFEELGLIDTFHIDIRSLYRFIIRARSMYRNVAYHNFFHAFDVTHMLFYLIKILDDEVQFTNLEKLALMVAGVVHDVDHMGLNNSYHLKCDTPMGILYSSVGIDSVLEIHHCNIAIEMLNLHDHNVFASLDSADSTCAYRWLVEIILATDMSHHSELLEEFVRTCQTTTNIKEFPRSLLLKMMIKSADLSNVVRPFHLSKRWAKCVTEEFYAQGDEERKHGRQVTDLFDRTKNANLADSQLGFISHVGKKHFTAMRDFCPSRLQWMVDTIENNVKQWEQYKATHSSDL